MSESTLFLIGFVIFGVAIAATLVGTIAGDDSRESLKEELPRVEQPGSVAEDSVNLKQTLHQMAVML